MPRKLPRNVNNNSLAVGAVATRSGLHEKVAVGLSRPLRHVRSGVAHSPLRLPGSRSSRTPGTPGTTGTPRSSRSSGPTRGHHPRRHVLRGATAHHPRSPHHSRRHVLRTTATVGSSRAVVRESSGSGKVRLSRVK